MKENLYKFFSVILFFVLFFNFKSFGIEIYYIDADKVVTSKNGEFYNLLNEVFSKEKRSLMKKYGIQEKNGKFFGKNRGKLLTFKREIKKTLFKLSRGIEDIFKELVYKFAKGKNYPIIVTDMEVIYVNEKYNLTDEFFKFANFELKRNKSKYIKKLKNRL